MRYDDAMTAQQAIALSIQEGRIIHLAYTVDLGAELTLACEDGAEHPLAEPRIDEYWGTTDAGHEWRVHLYGEG